MEPEKRERSPDDREGARMTGKRSPDDREGETSTVRH